MNVFTLYTSKTNVGKRVRLLDEARERVQPDREVTSKILVRVAVACLCLYMILHIKRKKCVFIV